MSVSSTPGSDKINTRYSTPVPELDDHRPRRQAPPPVRSPNLRSPVVPALEVQQPTPRRNTFETGLLHVDDALRDVQATSPTVTRDFEHAIEDDGSSDGDNDEKPAGARRVSENKRRFTNREGRPRRVEAFNQSRDTSSTRSSSPANSIEAFAEPRRRQRANTAESVAPSFIDNLRARTYSSTSAERRPTLSNVSLPPALLQDDSDDLSERDVPFPVTDEGRAYRIDFEELEEFVALSEQGLLPEENSDGRRDAVGGPRVFHDLRHGSQTKEDIEKMLLQNGKPGEKPLNRFLTSGTSQEVDSMESVLKNAPVVDPEQERFCFFSSQHQGAMFATKLGDFTRDGTTFSELFDIGPDGAGMWWLDVQNPTKAETEAIAKAFKVHRMTAEDIYTQEAREKVELFPQYYFVCFRSYNHDKASEDFLDPVHVYIIVCRDGVLSFSYSDTPHARNVRKRIAKQGDFMSLGPDYICYAMIDDIVDSFAPIIRDAEHESENIEDQVFIAREDDFAALLRQIGECRKRVLNMMRLLGGKADVIKGFAKRCNEQYSVAPRGDIGIYLGDIQDHVVTMMSNLGHVEKMLSRSHANYLAQLNVDNILKGNNTNKALAKITVVATILVPLNLVCGLFGMNVPVPGRATEGLGWFFGIVGVIAGFVIVSLIVAKRMKMI